LSPFDGIMFLVTLRCNLSCPRCFARVRSRMDRAQSDMTWAQYTRAVDRCKELGVHVKWLQFSGGEATLWPHLSKAIAYARASGICDKVRITSNAVDRNLSDYGGADLVSLSHYGAINRADIARIKRQSRRTGQRVDMGCVVHLPWPWPGLDRRAVSLPAECSCVLYAFIQDKVYPCSFAAIVAPTHYHCSVDDDFPVILSQQNPRHQPLCASCLSNRKLRRLYGEPLTVEWGVWDAPIAKLWQMPWRGRILRRLHRAYRKWRLDTLWRVRHDEVHEEES